MDISTLSKDNYDELANAFRTEYPNGAGLELNYLIGWLEKIHISTSNREMVVVYSMLQLELEDMPLYINHRTQVCRVLSKWRLRIGR